VNRRSFVTRGLGWGTAGASIGALAGALGAKVSADEERSAAGSSPVADVRRFGAVGDGKADDGPAIQRAIDSRAGTVLLSRGTYRIRRPLRVPLAKLGWTSVVGSGCACVIMRGSGPAFWIEGTHEGTADPPGFDDRVWDGERLPVLSGFEIRGDDPRADGVRLERTTQAIISDVLIRRCRVGVHLVARNRNPVISRCHIYDNREIGIFFDAVNLHQAIIADCHISYNPVAGILLRGGDMRNFQIVGNDIEYNHDEKRSGSADVLIDMGEKGSSFREGTIVGNTIQARPSPAGANIRVIGGEGHESGGLLAISGNLIGSQTDGIDLRRCRGVAISGNSIYSAMDRTLRLRECANITFVGNTIDWNPYRTGKRYVDGIRIDDCDGVVLCGVILENSFAGSRESGGAIEVHGSRDVTISDCQVLDPRFRGVVLRGVTRGRISGSTVLRRDGKATGVPAIEVVGGRDNHIIASTVPVGGLQHENGTTRVDGLLEVQTKA